MEHVVLIKDLLAYISEKLKTNSVFKNYVISKNNKTLAYKVDDGVYRIELNTYKSFDLERKEVSNELTPYYYRKFDVLHNWFKKYTVLSSSDFNSRASIFLEGSNLGFQNNFHFLVTNQDFKKDFTFFLEEIAKASIAFTDKFQTLNNLYEYEALPIINNKNFKFSMNSDEDLFILLRLVFLVEPSHFNELNERIYNHLKIMCEVEHPHALAYMSKYDEIIISLKVDK